MLRAPRSSPIRRLAALAAVLVATGTATACGSDGDTTAATDASVGDAAVAPIANQDHWHAAFGIYVCDTFLPDLPDVGPDALGIHTHQDGLVHIHPFVDSAAGENATLGVLTDQIGVTLFVGHFALPEDPNWTGSMDGNETWTGATEWTDGDECPQGPGKVRLFVWPPGAQEGDEPEVVDAALARTRFAEDGQRFVLAFVPDGVVPPQPPSTPLLADPGDVHPAPSETDPDAETGTSDTEPSTGW